MKGVDSMEVFGELMRRDPGLLAKPVEELVPISFIGGAAVSAYRSIISKLGNLPLTQEQKEKTLKDGQDAGKMLLAIEGRIGELLPKGEFGGGDRHSEKFKKFSRSLKDTGTTPKQRTIARTISEHPKIVEEVIKEAEENEDIPTKTAVLNKIAYEKDKEFKKEERDKSRGEMGADTMSYLIQLDKAYGIIKRTPDQITDKGWIAISKSLMNIKYLIEEITNESQNILQDNISALPGA